MFCPVCRDEYRPGFTHCATCDVALLTSLDAATAAPAARPAPTILAEIGAEEATANYCGFLTLEEAREARDKVRGAGMPAEILIKDAPAPAGASPQEEYWLRVRPRDFRAIVGLVGFTPAEALDADDSFGCSSCGVIVHATDDACPGCGLRFEE